MKENNKKLNMLKNQPTQGWITKRGQIIPTWKKRWFIYKDGILAYYSKKDGQIKGQLLISDCLVTLLNDTNNLGFAITIPGRTMRCKCETINERNKWVAVLRGEKEPNNLDVLTTSETKTTTATSSSTPTKGKKKTQKIQFGEEEAEVLDEKSSTTLIKSTSESGNIIKFEVAHRHPREIYFTIDITGSTNLKLKDSLANKRTQTVQPEWLTKVGLVTVMNPLKEWSLVVKYSWEVEMAP
jgi:hypothetical protein